MMAAGRLRHASFTHLLCDSNSSDVLTTLREDITLDRRSSQASLSAARHGSRLRSRGAGPGAALAKGRSGIPLTWVHRRSHRPE